MKEKWDKLCEIIFTTDSELSLYISKLPPAQGGNIKRFTKSWNTLKNKLNELDTIFSPPKLDVKTGFKGDKFVSKWCFWKSYLLSQHGIVLSSYAEQIALERLEKETGTNEDKAIKNINYSIFKLYRAIYPAPEKTIEPDLSNKNNESWG